MGRHRSSHLPPASSGGHQDTGDTVAASPSRGGRRRVVGALFSLSVAVMVVAAVLGSLQLAGTTSDGTAAELAAGESLAAHHRPHGPPSTNRANRGNRPQPAPSASTPPTTAGETTSTSTSATSSATAPSGSSSGTTTSGTTTSGTTTSGTTTSGTTAPGTTTAAGGGSTTSAAPTATQTATAPGVVPAAAAAPAPPCTKYIATTGNDAAAGSADAPWRNVLQSLDKATAGAVLCVMPGTYTQEVVDSTVPDGTAAKRVTLRSYDPARRATLDGRFSLSGLSFWTIRDLVFTNPTPTTTSGAPATSITDQRIVALIGGNDVVFQGNEVFNGVYAGLLVGRAGSSAEIPQRYTIRGNYVHDTASANLYFNTGRWSTGNLIERNVFANSGTENTKIGWGDDCRGVATDTDAYGAGEVEYRYNTLSNGGKGGSFIAAEPGGIYEVHVHHNIFADPQSERGFVVRYDSATNSSEFPNGCAGDKVWVTDNIGIGGTRFSEDFGDSPVSQSHESGNVFPLDPQLGADFVPRNPAARAYGHAAP